MKKLAGAALNSFMTKCASDASASWTKQPLTRSFRPMRMTSGTPRLWSSLQLFQLKGGKILTRTICPSSTRPRALG
jgi:hypothetical protein